MSRCGRPCVAAPGVSGTQVLTRLDGPWKRFPALWGPPNPCPGCLWGLSRTGKNHWAWLDSEPPALGDQVGRAGLLGHSGAWTVPSEAPGLGPNLSWPHGAGPQHHKRCDLLHSTSRSRQPGGWAGVDPGVGLGSSSCHLTPALRLIPRCGLRPKRVALGEMDVASAPSTLLGQRSRPG